uniref:Uncharacterized protein n=1 Tax=Rhizophora mucronata TaxID=61149 RepID=A0A2P2P8Y9_RHIMU
MPLSSSTPSSLGLGYTRASTAQGICFLLTF